MPEDLKFNCPHCDQRLEAPEEILGEVIECPTCNGSIQLPEPESSDHSDSRLEPPPLPKTRTSLKRGYPREKSILKDKQKPGSRFYIRLLAIFPIAIVACGTLYHFAKDPETKTATVQLLDEVHPKTTQRSAESVLSNHDWASDPERKIYVIKLKESLPYLSGEKVRQLSIIFHPPPPPPEVVDTLLRKSLELAIGDYNSTDILADCWHGADGLWSQNSHDYNSANIFTNCWHGDDGLWSHNLLDYNSANIFTNFTDFFGVFWNSLGYNSHDYNSTDIFGDLLDGFWSHNSQWMTSGADCWHGADGRFPNQYSGPLVYDAKEKNIGPPPPGVVGMTDYGLTGTIGLMRGELHLEIKKIQQMKQRMSARY